ncbi:MAG: type II toxin-antitoxin system VapC family toxin [Methylococcales symbiont of Iophon sp. n. MRB-2018]|nr:MAG: type II toxin-antitoxin system VapC family toxin [Methylococcales symbiont of Iophon sp. n. MRB-2018]KAF3979256.1 MAG: type II toxin-antitoxin system VapC family toxin [Methylococcales symbiont of Iophon sp. n. MRB-2018]
MYMLDTDICIYVLKKHSDKLRHKFKVTKNICISSVTYGELCFGIENGDNPMREARWKELNLFTQRLFIEPWGESAAKHYGSIRALLRKQGTLIGNNDLLIAAHARSLDSVMVTNNIREFKRVPNLTLENWI